MCGPGIATVFVAPPSGGGRYVSRHFRKEGCGEMKSFVRRTSAIVIVECVVSVCVGMGTVQTDYRCITLLTPKTCNAIGNSMCQATSPCGGVCTWCNATTSLPDKICVRWEGYTCAENGSAQLNCNTGRYRRGKCLVVGSCSCTNDVDAGNCTGSWNWDCT